MGLESQLGAITSGPAPLQGGITNRNYLVHFGQRRCVVRLPGKDTALLRISREAERIAGQAAARLGLAPAVIAATDECLVTEYVDGEPFRPAQLRADPATVARALRRFHDAGVSLPVRFWVPELLERYAQTVRDRGATLPAEYDRARAVAGQIAQALPLGDPVACHDDLLPANILAVGAERSVMLLDWEYAGMGHRFFDLGNFAAGAELDEAQEVGLLSAYFGERPSAGRSAALALMRIMSDVREAAWGVVQSVISGLDFDFERYAAVHFGRLEDAVADPRLEGWLRAAAT